MYNILKVLIVSHIYPILLTALTPLTDHDIQQIYNNHVKPNLTSEYAQRYLPLPLSKNTLPWRWEGKDFPRVIALLEFERYVVDNNIVAEKALGINGFQDPEWFYLKTKQAIKIDYSEDPINHNIYTLNLKDSNFDFVMLNQTLEHLYDPIRALENLYKHMKEGGILYINVPANNIPHSTPHHYYTGYTPVGLGAVVKAAGFKILSIGQWGNTEYLKKLFEMNYWPDYRQLPNNLINDFNCPIITWVFAQK